MFKIIGSDGIEYGPVSAVQVRQWLAQGRVNAQTQIKPEGAADWQPLSTLPEFAAEFTTPAIPPPVTPLAASESPSKTSGMAITSLVLGILGLFSCGITAIVGLVLGIVAMVKIKKSEDRLSGQGLAIAGTAVSGVMILLLPIYAAMLLPALAKSKQKAQTIHCVSNLKQLGLAVRMYAADHNGTFPSATNWCDALQNDLGTARVFSCPAAPGLDCAYAYNRKLDTIKESDVNPQTVMFFGSRAGWNASGGPELLDTHGHSGGKLVVGFADGHVEQVSLARLAELRWEP